MAAQFILAADVVSTFKKGFIYGKKGTGVTEVTRSGDILIVEDKNGERYSVNVNKLLPK
jgi:predicted RecB family endonuclease